MKTFRFLALLLLAYPLYSCSVTNVSSAPEEEEPSGPGTPGGFTEQTFDLYLLIGQSNMAGRAELSSDVADTLTDVFLFNGVSWEKAANPLNRHSTARKDLSMQKLGPGYTFSKTLAERLDRGIGLVVNARGGTRIEQWQKGYSGSEDFDLYEGALERIRKVAGTGQLKGIIWHQGESNQNSTANYLANLNKMVWDLRSDLGLPQLYFVAGELGTWRESSREINDLIRRIPQQLANSSVVSADGLTPLNGDSTDPHFDNPSQQLLGVRYAEEVLRVLYDL